MREGKSSATENPLREQVQNLRARNAERSRALEDAKQRAPAKSLAAAVDRLRRARGELQKVMENLKEREALRKQLHAKE